MHRPTRSRFDREVLILDIVLAALVVLLLAASYLSTSLQDTCLEDEDCWDCSTMGNLQCGPIPLEEIDQRGLTGSD